MPELDLIETPVAESKPAETSAPAPAADAKPAAEKTAPAADSKTPAKEPEAKAAPAKADEKPAKAETADDDLDFGDEDEGDGKAPATWPEDWREKLAGSDEKWLKELKRFASPESFAKSQRALRQKLSSGEYRRVSLPENATDEEKAEWRKENGIPEKPEGYELPAIKGHEWSDSDKPLINEFLTDLHAAGAPQTIAKAALGWYAKFQQQQVERISSLDRSNQEAREDALRSEWGPADYRPHVTLAREMFADENFIGKDLRAALADARTSSGMRLLHHPDFVKFLAQQGLERRGTAGLVSGEQGARLSSRLDEIKKIRDTDYERYYAEGLDKEYAELQEKVGSGRSR